MIAIHNSRKGDLSIGGFVFPAGKAVDVPDAVLEHVRHNSTFEKWAERGWLAPVQLSDAARAVINDAAAKAAKAAEAAKAAALETTARDEQGRTAKERAEEMRAALGGSPEQPADSKAQAKAPEQPADSKGKAK